MVLEILRAYRQTDRQKNKQTYTRILQIQTLIGLLYCTDTDFCSDCSTCKKHRHKSHTCSPGCKAAYVWKRPGHQQTSLTIWMPATLPTYDIPCSTSVCQTPLYPSHLPTTLHTKWPYSCYHLDHTFPSPAKMLTPMPGPSYPTGPSGPGPPSLRRPQTAQVLYFSSRKLSVTNCNFHYLTQQISFSVDNHLQNDT